MQAGPVDNGETGGVIAPVFKAAEPFDEKWTGLARSDISDNSAHR
jgi:hypothetical protein